MKYEISFSNQFKKDYKKCKNRGYNLFLLQEAISILADKGSLPKKYRPHKLVGNYRGLWECHLSADWLLVWSQDDDGIILANTGTHSDLFD